jgi:hypothetical protein
MLAGRTFNRMEKIRNLGFKNLDSTPFSLPLLCPVIALAFYRLPMVESSAGEKSGEES